MAGSATKRRRKKKKERKMRRDERRYPNRGKQSELPKEGSVMAAGIHAVPGEQLAQATGYTSPKDFETSIGEPTYQFPREEKDAVCKVDSKVDVSEVDRESSFAEIEGATAQCSFCQKLPKDGSETAAGLHAVPGEQVALATGYAKSTDFDTSIGEPTYQFPREEKDAICKVNCKVDVTEVGRESPFAEIERATAMDIESQVYKTTVAEEGTFDEMPSTSGNYAVLYDTSKKLTAQTRKYWMTSHFECEPDVLKGILLRQRLGEPTKYLDLEPRRQCFNKVGGRASPVYGLYDVASSVSTESFESAGYNDDYVYGKQPTDDKLVHFSMPSSSRQFVPDIPYLDIFNRKTAPSDAFPSMARTVSMESFENGGNKGECLFGRMQPTKDAVTHSSMPLFTKRPESAVPYVKKIYSSSPAIEAFPNMAPTVSTESFESGGYKDDYLYGKQSNKLVHFSMPQSARQFVSDISYLDKFYRNVPPTHAFPKVARSVSVESFIGGNKGDDRFGRILPTKDALRHYSMPLFTKRPESAGPYVEKMYSSTPEIKAFPNMAHTVLMESFENGGYKDDYLYGIELTDDKLVHFPMPQSAGQFVSDIPNLDKSYRNVQPTYAFPNMARSVSVESFFGGNKGDYRFGRIQLTKDALRHYSMPVFAKGPESAGSYVEKMYSSTPEIKAFLNMIPTVSMESFENGGYKDDYLCGKELSDDKLVHFPMPQSARQFVSDIPNLDKFYRNVPPTHAFPNMVRSVSVESFFGGNKGDYRFGRIQLTKNALRHYSMPVFAKGPESAGSYVEKMYSTTPEIKAFLSMTPTVSVESFFGGNKGNYRFGRIQLTKDALRHYSMPVFAQDPESAGPYVEKMYSGTPAIEAFPNMTPTKFLQRELFKETQMATKIATEISSEKKFVQNGLCREITAARTDATVGMTSDTESKLKKEDPGNGYVANVTPVDVKISKKKKKKNKRSRLRRFYEFFCLCVSPNAVVEDNDVCSGESHDEQVEERCHN